MWRVRAQCVAHAFHERVTALDLKHAAAHTKACCRSATHFSAPQRQRRKNIAWWADCEAAGTGGRSNWSCW